MTTYALRHANPAKTRCDAVVVGVLSTAKGPVVVPGAEDVSAAWGRRFRPLLSSLGFSGKAGEVVKVPSPAGVTSPLVVLVGLGAAPTARGRRARRGSSAEPDVRARRQAAGTAARSVTNAASVALALDAGDVAAVRAVLEGWLLGGYRFTRFKSDADANSTRPSEVVVLSPVARSAEAGTAFEEAQVVAAAVEAARDWVNRPAGDLRPPAFAEEVAAAADEVGRQLSRRKSGELAVTVHDEAGLAELGCGGILGVGAGSDAPPRLVELSYRAPDPVAHLALVGKGITFDSGGLSIKPAQSMGTMKCDMAGAAAVCQATLAVARLGLPLQVTAYAPMAENMLSGRAMRPGDVLTAADGTTVEVMNTDAEGRLVLMDALALAGRSGPDVLLDVATLTGHMVVALGDRLGGVMGSEDVVHDVLAAAEAAGEGMWPMPIPPEMKERISGSKVADLSQHDGVRWGGGLFAAAFLREFTGGRPWAHLDIAGPAFNTGSAHGHVPSGGTGFGVATLVEFARRLAAADRPAR